MGLVDPIGTTTALATTGASLYASATVTAAAVSNTLSAVDFSVAYFGTMIKHDPNWGAKRMENWAKLEFQHINSLTGIFRFDKSANGFEWGMQVLNNFGGGEILQDFAGNALGHQQNMAGNIDAMGYYKGRLVIRLNDNSIPGRAISLGHYVIGEKIALNPNDNSQGPDGLDLFAHEFGHTYQSRIMGPTYLFRIGIASVYDNDGLTEQDANWRSSQNNLPIYDWRPKTKSRYKSYEFGFAPVLWPFMWSWNF